MRPVVTTLSMGMAGGISALPAWCVYTSAAPTLLGIGTAVIATPFCCTIGAITGIGILYMGK